DQERADRASGGGEPASAPAGYRADRVDHLRGDHRGADPGGPGGVARLRRLLGQEAGPADGAQPTHRGGGSCRGQGRALFQAGQGAAGAGEWRAGPGRAAPGPRRCQFV
ncbi:MAG: Integration host factor beta subunit, partial [uncultured Craurococcus sp.]